MMIDQVTGQPVIEAESFVLRPPEMGDAGLLKLYAGDKRIACMTRSIPHPLPPGATEDFLRRSREADRKEDIWILDGRRAGQEPVLGVIGLARLDREQSEIGYWVAPILWNTGLATEAVRTLAALSCGDIMAGTQSNSQNAAILRLVPSISETRSA